MWQIINPIKPIYAFKYKIFHVHYKGIKLHSDRLERCGAMSYTIIDKIIVALKMDPLTNDAIKGVILIVGILVQIAGPKLKAKFAHT